MGQLSRFILTAAAVLLLGAYQISLGADCNNNGVDDRFDVITRSSPDCNSNFTPDECDVADGTSPDINGNGVPDECDVDCDDNGVSDDIDIAQGTHQDCNDNSMPDICDVDTGFSNDVNGNSIPDVCEPDCNNHGNPDDEDIRVGFSEDRNGNGVPDECDLAPRYRLIDLGTTAALGSSASALNESGEVVGIAAFCCLRNPSGGRTALVHGFRWQRDRIEDLGAMEMGSPPCSPAGCETLLLDVNNCGESVGWNTGPSGRLPVVWLPEGRGQLSAGYNLLPLPRALATGVAEATNDAGQIVGHAGSSLSRRPILWEFDGSAYFLRDLGMESSDPRQASATDINEHGQVVGQAKGGLSGLVSFLWLPEPAYGLNAGMNIITPGMGLFSVVAKAINNQGEITGGAGRPWIWLPEAAYGLPAGLNDIASPRAAIWPTSLNDSGQIVAGALVARMGTAGGTDSRAMLWQQGTWLMLDDLVVNKGSWRLANLGNGALNAQGFIVGNAFNHEFLDANGEGPVMHGYLLEPVNGRLTAPRFYSDRASVFNSLGDSSRARKDCRNR